ncbi:MAG TPA: hypothetical protein VIL20_25160 [Sandaracinaceae bacterium]
MASLHPSHGARIVLEREGSDAEVRYRVSIYEPGGVVHVTHARFPDDGTVLLDAWSSEPPAWALAFTDRLLKGLPKKHATDASWPRKITRWRDARG